MQSKEEIYTELKNILVDIFEMDESVITLEARLYEELDLDSIDAVDLVIKLQQITGKRVKPEEFKSARQVRDVVDIIYNLIRQ
jgi:acyl carrier protein